MKSSILLASVIAAVSASAQLTGDWGRVGRAGMMDGMYGGSVFGRILFGIFAIGVTLLVWLWVAKLWKEVRRMK